MGAQLQHDLASSRLLNMAKAITHVVDGALVQPDADFNSFKSDAVSTHNLIPYQERRLDRVVGRLIQARRIVRHLEGRFGVAESGRFEDKKGLYRATMNDVPPQYLSARPNSFTILYLVGEENMGGNMKGVAYTSNDIDDVLDRNMKELQRRNPRYFALSTLCIFVSHLEMKSAAMLRNYVDHETGHVVGNMLHPRDIDHYLSEIFADLFARLPATCGIRRHQVSAIHGEYRSSRNVHRRLKKRNAPPHVIRHKAREVQEFEKFIDFTKSLDPAVFNDIAGLGLDRRVLSIAVALHDYDEVMPVMSRLQSYLERHPEEARYGRPALPGYRR